MKKLREKMKSQGGFTLVEMLIVVAIIAILAAVSIPLVNTSLEKTRDATDEANLRAAKAAAVLMYMNHQLDSSNPEPKDGMYYDIASGSFKEVGTPVPSGYNKGKLGSSVTADSKYIIMTLTATPNNPVTVAWQS